MEQVVRYGRSTPHFMAVAKEKGFYAREGIEMQFVPGIPSYVGDKIVASEIHSMNTFAQSDSAVLIQSMTEGLPIVCVGGLFYDAVGFGGLKSRGITKPKDIEGHRIGFAGGSGEALMFPVFCKENGVDVGRVEVAYSGTGMGRMEPIPEALFAGKVDLFGGYWPNYGWKLVEYRARQEGTDAVYFKYGDYGLHAYSFCQVCNTRMVKEKPSLVRGFLKATIEGLRWQLDHPAETVETSMKYRDYPKSVVEASVAATAETIHGPGVDKHGLGWTSMDVWDELQSRLYHAGRIIGENDLSGLVTNEFLPGEG